MDDLIAIGRFARMTGLSVGVLRRYDELDILRPAYVDAVTGQEDRRIVQADIEGRPLD